MYKVTRTFTAGPLTGLTYTSTTAVAFKVGDTIAAGPYTGSPYTITEVKEVSA